ncbi:MAG: DUF2259 domain-containing protein [Rhizobiales bacterium]|nr:DUF2259 domain-containing protein [Hyphomicrobiales bacterium]
MKSRAVVWKQLIKTIAIVCGFGFASNAYAGTLSKLGETGFSPDGAYFSFEQYGIEDGSGFPFSNITIIDVLADKWVENSPFEVKIEDTAEPIFAARQKVQAQIAGIIQKLGISSNNGDTVAYNPISQLGGKPDWMQFLPFSWGTGGHQSIEINLETYPLTSRDDCDVFGPTYGFRLVMIRGSATQTLYQDSEIPKSRFCPQSYQLDRIEAFVTPDKRLVLAIIVRVYTPGFEGQDASYLAVVKQMPL